jgi:hypothetical protein
MDASGSASILEVRKKERKKQRKQERKKERKKEKESVFNQWTFSYCKHHWS